MEQLKDIREGKGWTQEDLAQRLGVTSHTISLWERGQTRPRSDMTLRKLRRVLGLTTQEMADLMKETE